MSERAPAGQALAREASESPAAAGDGVPRVQLEEWRQDPGVVAGITGGSTAGPALDFGLAGDRPVGEVMDAWTALQRAFAAGFDGVVVGRQRHGVEIAVHDRPVRGLAVLDGIDGHVTTATGLLLAVTAADCVPVYLAAPGAGVALLHAGWRGIAGGILEAGVERLAASAGVEPEDVVMHCGVGICGRCYEVGPEVFEALDAPPGGDRRIDLRAVLSRRAHALGLRRITSSPWCTRHHRAFFSHRRDGARSGRMIAFAGRPSP